MNKTFISIVAVSVILLFLALKYSQNFNNTVLSKLQGVESSYFSVTDYISDQVQEHFLQERTIQEQRLLIEKYKKSDLKLLALKNELDGLYNEYNSTLKTEPKVELIRTISYSNFGDLNKMWVEMPDFNASKIYGLVSENVSAGIIVSKFGKPQALLNSDPKCSYAVIIGEKQAPGIIRGKKTHEMVIEFIPTWIDIKVGDEVKTSGLDNLFFANIKVGKIKSIYTSQGYQAAVVAPYYTEQKPTYFYAITQVK